VTSRLSCHPHPRLPALTHSVLALTLLASGCAVGPDYHAPSLAAGAGYTPAPLPAQIGGAATLGGARQALQFGRDIAGDWWTLFRSPALNGLIAQALAHNPSLQSAQATLLAARETARAQAGGLFPAVSAALGVTRELSPYGGVSGVGTGTTGGATTGGTGTSGAGFAGGSSVFNLYNASVSVSYTLDLWGKVRRGVEQAQAQATYEQFALEASYLTLTSNIVSGAIAEASLQAQIDATEEVVDAEQDGLRIIRAQLAAGAITRVDLLQQEAQLQTTLATLPPLRSSLAQERNLLASYVGAFPNQFADPHFSLATLHLPQDLPMSLPSSLVAQRPDVQQSAAQLHEQTAAVGVATANLLPQLTLSGSVGSEALAAGSLFSGGSLAYSLAAQLAQTVFEGGTLVHQRRAAIATMQAAAAQYQTTVINAFANVADALQALQFDATALQVSLDAAKAATDSLNLLRVQYQAGSVTQLSVLTAEQTEQMALVTLAKSQAARYADTAALFAALGGGWWNRTDVAPGVARCCGLLQ
jgi:NodT family efflux transporter outer membrane factor (OMF) lipoprotein